MHQLATGQDLKCHELSEVYAGTGVQVRRARVTAVDADPRTVALVDDHGADEIAYETLAMPLAARQHLRGVVDRLGIAVHEHTDIIEVDSPSTPSPPPRP
jgi:NADH dehydrogenase